MSFDPKPAVRKINEGRLSPPILPSCMVPRFRKGVCDANCQAAFRFLVNKPGRLAAMMTALGKEKVEFLALSVMDSGERGCVRFVPDNMDATMELLQGMNVHYDVADVSLVEIPSQTAHFARFARSWLPST